jgi:hypothetical protein
VATENTSREPSKQISDKLLKFSYVRFLMSVGMDWLYPVGPAEYAFYLRTETQTSVRNIALNKNITMENAQKVNN